ncbi:MAG: heme biosynthesis HemY N-terminal domain-containing protein [Candidatus Methylumidiphilus sp.]
MRRALLYLFGCLVAVGATVFALRYVSSHGGSGYVIVGIGQWSVESSLLFTGVLLAVTFVLLYFAVRLIVTAISLPKILKQRGFEQRSKRSQEALLTGLIESAEGNFETAEKHLIRHAANSGVPLINYLTAARAAQSRGALEQRDEYLKLAQETMPEAELAIGLTKVELQLSNQQFEEALESLTQLDKIAPSHAAVLKLMHQAYANLADWQGLSLIIPQLKSNKVMMEAEIKLLETETFCSLIKQKTEARDAVALRNLWLEIPGHIRKSSGVLQLYCAAMIEAGAEVEVEPLVRQAIGTEWSETLIVLYGCIHMPDTVDQLVKGEAWLKAHPKDAILLRVLGKLSLRAGLLDKAASYLKASLAAEPSVEAYQLMGDVLMKENDPLSACQFFRNGLLFASNEVVALIEQNPEVDAAEGEG